MMRLMQVALALWAALLVAVVCLVFLPTSLLAAMLLMLSLWGLIIAAFYTGRQQLKPQAGIHLAGLPAAGYRQPVVLVCGDLPQIWPIKTPVILTDSGCWIRVYEHQELEQVVGQVLWLRPDWGEQLSIMVSVCPQHYADSASLNRHLLRLRWQISHLRSETCWQFPVILSNMVASSMVNDMLWQAAVSQRDICVWREDKSVSSVSSWLAAGGAIALQQQIMMNTLMSWCRDSISAVFLNDDPDIPRVAPAAILWGIAPSQSGVLRTSVWTEWLQQHTAIKHGSGWQPANDKKPLGLRTPDFILAQLPKRLGLSTVQRIWRKGLLLFTLAGGLALGCSGWNNSQLLAMVHANIYYYNSVKTPNHRMKGDVLRVLRANINQIDDWTQHGVPLCLSLGLYQGKYLHQPLLEALNGSEPLHGRQVVSNLPEANILSSHFPFCNSDRISSEDEAGEIVNAVVGRHQALEQIYGSQQRSSTYE